MRKINGRGFPHEFTKTERSIKKVGCLIVVINVVIIGAVICGVVYGCNQIKSKGLKNCVEDIWEGPGTNSVDTTNNP